MLVLTRHQSTLKIWQRRIMSYKEASLRFVQKSSSGCFFFARSISAKKSIVVFFRIFKNQGVSSRKYETEIKNIEGHILHVLNTGSSNFWITRIISNMAPIYSHTVLNYIVFRVLLQLYCHVQRQWYVAKVFEQKFDKLWLNYLHICWDIWCVNIYWFDEIE